TPAHRVSRLYPGATRGLLRPPMRLAVLRRRLDRGVPVDTACLRYVDVAGRKPHTQFLSPATQRARGRRVTDVAGLLGAQVVPIPGELVRERPEHPVAVGAHPDPGGRPLRDSRRRGRYPDAHGWYAIVGLGGGAGHGVARSGAGRGSQRSWRL